jgi:hypothetical protein
VEREVGDDGAVMIESFTPEKQTIDRAAVRRSIAPGRDGIAREDVGCQRGLPA